MINRQIPNDFHKNDFLEKIEYIEKVFGKKWLIKNKNNHPLKQLWHRQDFLASNELYVIGLGIEKALKNNEKEWIDNFVQEVKKHKDIRQIQAICYELFVYTLFRNKVILAQPNQQSYDLIVSKDIQKVRVSIKRLTESDNVGKLYNDFVECKEFLKSTLEQLQLNAYQVLLMFNESDYYDLNLCKSLIKNILINKQDEANENYMTILKKLQCENQNWIISDKKKSFILNLIIKINQNEQKRFINLFKKASKNLNQIEPNKNEINMITIGLPEYISFDLAQNWIINEFDKGNYTRISGVLLTRYLLVQDIKNNTTLLNLESRLICNMKAKYQLNFNDEIFKLVLPVGTISQKEAIKSFVNENGDKFELKNYYSFQEGYRLCEPLFFNKHINFNFSYIQNFTEEIIYQDKIVAPVRPKGDKLLCL